MCIYLIMFFSTISPMDQLSVLSNTSVPVDDCCSEVSYSYMGLHFALKL